MRISYAHFEEVDEVHDHLREIMVDVPETYAAANAVLIDAQDGIGLARAWGGGLVAAADGMRFVVPVRAVHARPNPKYFGQRRGATWLNAVNTGAADGAAAQRRERTASAANDNADGHVSSFWWQGRRRLDPGSAGVVVGIGRRTRRPARFGRPSRVRRRRG